jgi:hypothetical protein
LRSIDEESVGTKHGCYIGPNINPLIWLNSSWELDIARPCDRLIYEIARPCYLIYDSVTYHYGTLVMRLVSLMWQSL